MQEQCKSNVRADFKIILLFELFFTNVTIFQILGVLLIIDN